MLNFLGGSRGSAGALTRPSTRHLLPKNIEKTALKKRGGIFAVKMRGGIIAEITVISFPNYLKQECTLSTFPELGGRHREVCVLLHLIPGQWKFGNSSLLEWEISYLKRNAGEPVRSRNVYGAALIQK